MGQIKTVSPVLLFMAVFSADEKAFAWTRERVVERFGPIELESESFRFDEFTDYYAKTMGGVLTKRLWGFRDPIDPSSLATIKCQTNDWEDRYKASFPSGLDRPLNIDPGYVDLGKLILASTKDHAHRIYLQDGIFAETTLMFTRKHWKSLPWTYPDYQSEGYQKFLDQCRDYLKTLR